MLVPENSMIVVKIQPGSAVPLFDDLFLRESERYKQYNLKHSVRTLCARLNKFLIKIWSNFETTDFIIKDLSLFFFFFHNAKPLWFSVVSWMVNLRKIWIDHYFYHYIHPVSLECCFSSIWWWLVKVAPNYWKLRDCCMYASVYGNLG